MFFDFLKRNSIILVLIIIAGGVIISGIIFNKKEGTDIFFGILKPEQKEESASKKIISQGEKQKQDQTESEDEKEEESPNSPKENKWERYKVLMNEMIGKMAEAQTIWAEMTEEKEKREKWLRWVEDTGYIYYQEYVPLVEITQEYLKVLKKALASVNELISVRESIVGAIQKKDEESLKESLAKEKIKTDEFNVIYKKVKEIKEKLEEMENKRE